MSDEYRNNGFKDSLVNDSLGNYPPPGDTTSSGGYSSVKDPSAQRGSLTTHSDTPDSATTGALQQSTTGTDLRPEIRDAKQGQDLPARRDARADEHRRGLDPYDQSSLESRPEAERVLGERFSVQ
ncbi:hypothetical protein BV22DRAFT_1194433 [Leucogyrophana mollusca]|uniref:Uncharacterized protein n=1 Tax=Leucogyrophana mollusca TaxID=85980 RepID=A0ACB8BKV0_9AGAM|nr:hypothetical protein BV22DRAFT_1194433 [Leucogyrophana mollusca]